MDYKQSLQGKSTHNNKKSPLDTRDPQNSPPEPSVQINIQISMNKSKGKFNENHQVLKKINNLSPVKKGFFHIRKNSDPLQQIKLKRQVRQSRDSIYAMPEIAKKKETFDFRSTINHSFLDIPIISSSNCQQSKSALVYQGDLHKTINGFNGQKRYGHHRVRSQVQDYGHNDSKIEEISRNYLNQNLDDLISSQSLILRKENFVLEDKFPIPTRLMKPKYVKQTLNSTFYLPLSTLSTNISTQNAHVMPLGRDTSLNNATNEMNRRWNRYKKMQNDLLSLKASQCDLVKKQILLKQFKIKLPHVKLSQCDIIAWSSYDLESLFYKEVHKVKQQQAAIKIQSLYKMHRQRKQYLKIRQIRLIAKEKIKNMWKKCRWHRLVKQMTQQKKNDAAIRVRKYLMGFIISRKVMQDLANKKVEDSIKYFEAKKIEVQSNAQIKISYYWRRYMRQAVKRAQDQNRQLSPDQRGKFKRRLTKDYQQKPGPTWGFSKMNKQKTIKLN